MPQNKKHHYVPRFYLKRFSSDKKSICVYNLPKKKKIVGANLKSQCYKDYLYGKDSTVEKALADLEGQISLLFRMIDEFGSLPPSFTEHHAILVMATLIQFGRTKYSADAMDEFHDKIFKQAFRPKFEAEHKDINLDDFIIGIEDVATYSTAMTTKIFPYALDLGLKLLKNETPVEFITSDNPVVMINPLLSFRRFGSNTGLSTKGLQIYYPISPHYLTLFYDSDVYRVGRESLSVIPISNEQDVYSLNTLQACSCYKNLYFRDPQLNTVALDKNARKYLRDEKVHVKAYPEYEDERARSELVINYREDIRYTPKLSFLSTKKSAKKWRENSKKQSSHTAMVYRDENFHYAVDECLKKVEEGDLNGFEILQHLKENLSS